MNPPTAARAATPTDTPLRRQAPEAVYEMRQLRTDAERDEAAALVQDRHRWLVRHALPIPARPDLPALFRNPAEQPVGLFEDGRLLACMICEHSPALEWERGQCLYLGYLHTLPDQPDNATRLITLWASDYAARHGLPCVRAEVPASHPLVVEPIAALLRRCIDMGWDAGGSGPSRDGERVAHLQLAADHRPGLRALISCQVPPPPVPAVAPA